MLKDTFLTTMCNNTATTNNNNKTTNSEATKRFIAGRTSELQLVSISVPHQQCRISLLVMLQTAVHVYEQSNIHTYAYKSDEFLTMLAMHISDQFQSPEQLHPCLSKLHSILYQPNTSIQLP